MSCKNCKWSKVYDFIFPDGTKSIACEKYNKHLGFTNKKGQVKYVKAVSEYSFNNIQVNRVINIEEEELNNCRLILLKGKWAVEVEEYGITNVIFSSKHKNEAEEKIKMFKDKKSWITGIYYNKRYKKWTAKIYIGESKYKQIGSFKTFYEAKKALREAKIYL